MSKRETAWEVRKKLLPGCGLGGGNCKEIVSVNFGACHAE